MELTRTRSTRENLSSTIFASWELKNGAVWLPYSASLNIGGGGLAKDFKDTGIKYNTSKKGRSWNGDYRTVANFLPIRVSTLQIGNTRFSGNGHTFAPSCFNLTTRRNITLSGDILGSVLFYQRDMYERNVDKRGVPPTSINIDAKWARLAMASAQKKTSEAVYDLGITLAELGETAAMLANPLNGLAKLCSKHLLNGGSFKKHMGNLLFRPSKANRSKRRFGKEFGKTGYRIVDQSSNFWLSWRFGVKPLLQDIDNLMSMSFDSFSKEEVRFSHASAGKQTSEFWLRQCTGGVEYYDIDFLDHVVTKERHNATLAYRRQHGGGLEAFLSAFGLNWHQIPKIMWELVPCSFVVDRFVDIGTWLSNISPDPHVHTFDTCVSRKWRRTRTRQFMGFKYKSYTANVAWSQTNVPMLKVYSSAYTREIGWKTPIIPLLNPRMLSLSQHIDHATLIWQRLPKGR